MVKGHRCQAMVPVGSGGAWRRRVAREVVDALVTVAIYAPFFGGLGVCRSGTLTSAWEKTEYSHERSRECWCVGKREARVVVVRVSVQRRERRNNNSDATAARVATVRPMERRLSLFALRPSASSLGRALFCVTSVS